MARQSISFIKPNDEWLKAQVNSKEYSGKSELINDLIRQARKQQLQIDWIRAKLENAENSGFTNNSKEQIFNFLNNLLLYLKQQTAPAFKERSFITGAKTYYHHTKCFNTHLISKALHYNVPGSPEPRYKCGAGITMDTLTLSRAEGEEYERKARRGSAKGADENFNKCLPTLIAWSDRP